MIWILLLLVFIIFAVTILLYNKLMTLKVRVDEAWSGMDVQLRKRYDLLPKLVESVEKATSSESSIQTAIAELRTRDVISSDRETQAALDKRITPLVQNVIVTVEKYPELRSIESILLIQKQMVEIEESIAFARKYYNGTVRQFNTAINSFPQLVIAKSMKMSDAVYFEADQEARKDIKTN
jgi:LemA protein